MKNNFKIDFIGIGAQKCATSWIAQCLNEHPKICLSNPKELHFFNKKGLFYHEPTDWKYSKGIKWYKSHFNHCKNDNLKGEFSTHYYHDPETPKLIYKHFPKAKLIFVVRNPIERLISSYFEGKFTGKLKRRLPSFKKVIKTEPDFIASGLYINHIKNFLKYFPRKQLFVLIYEDIEKDSLKFIQKIYKFLEVNDKFNPPSLNKAVNPTGPKTSPIRSIFIHSKNMFMQSRVKKITTTILKPLGITKLLKFIILKPIIKFMRLTSKNKKRPSVRSSIRKYLNEIYQPYNKQLEKFIKRDLSFWQ